MNAFHPYITFDGNCEAALRFYERCFNGKIIFIQYYDEAAAFNPGTLGEKVMHSEFKAGPLHFMACDKTNDQTISNGTNISLYASFSDEDAQRKTFTKLCVNGRVHLNLEKTVWGSTIGIVTDQFGIHWMLVYNID